MSHVKVPLGGSKKHKIEIKSGNVLTDPDSNSATVVIIQPASGANPPTVSSPAVRLSTGVYESTITALSNSTLSADLTAGDHWEVRYLFTVNTVTPNATDRTFTFEVVPVAEVSESFAFVTINQVRDGMLERDEIQTGKTGTTLTLTRQDGQSIIKAVKNGTEITQVTSSPGAGQYSFVKPNKITLGTAAVVGDTYDIKVGVYLSDDDIQKHIDEIHQIILAKIEIAYTLPFTSTPPLLAKIERWITQWAIALQLEGHPVFRVSDAERIAYKERYDDCKQLLMNLVEGDITLFDGSGDEISRKGITTDDETFITFKSSSSE